MMKLSFMEYYLKISKEAEILSIICGSLAEIYKDGLKINTAIKIVKDAVNSKIYKESLEDVIKGIEDGKTLSESFSQFENLYPKLMTSMIKMGEESGELYFVLKALKFYYLDIYEIKKKTKKAVSYPGFILVFFIVMALYLFKCILPNILNLYNSMEIPFSETVQVIKNISEIINNDIMLFFIYTAIYVFILPYIGFKYIFNKYSDKIKCHISIWKMYYEYKMILMLYILFNSKLNISKGLNICEQCAEGEILSKAFLTVKTYINKGYDLTYSLQKSYILSPYSLSIIRIHEEGGSLEKAFFQLKEKKSVEILEKIEKYISTIEPALIIILAGIICMFFLNIILPIMEGVNNISI